MTKKKKKGVSGSGSGVSLGKSVYTDPFSKTLEEEADTSEAGIKEIPRGVPVSPEEFKRLKRAADQPSPKDKLEEPEKKDKS